MLVKHDDVVKKVSKNLNMPYEQVRILFNDFYQQLVMHLQHPENNFTHGIMIRDCIKLRLNPRKVMISYNNILKKGTYNSESNFVVNLKNIHQNLLENDIYTEKQKETIKNYERDYLSETGNKRYYSDEEE